MAAQSSIEVEDPIRTTPQRRRRGPLIAIGAVLVVLIVGAAALLGFWLGSRDESAAPPAGIEQLIVDYRRAIGVDGSGGFDDDAFSALVTEGFREIDHMYYEFGHTIRQTGTFVTPADEYYVVSPWELLQGNEDLVVAGSGPWFVSAVENYVDSL